MEERAVYTVGSATATIRGVPLVGPADDIPELDAAYARRLMDALVEWQPGRAPHCSNCSSAHVYGLPARPEARCIHGHAEDMELLRLIRHKNPRAFRTARGCPDYESVGEE